MIITILRQKYLELRNELFQWLTNKGRASIQIMGSLTHKNLLGYHGFLNAIANQKHHIDK